MMDKRNCVYSHVVTHLRKADAKYQIEETFKITGRGIVLAGTVLEGEINIGDLMIFEFKNSVLVRKITGIEGIRATIEKPNTGILIECINETEIDELRNWNPNKIIAEIITLK